MQHACAARMGPWAAACAAGCGARMLGSRACIASRRIHLPPPSSPKRTPCPIPLNSMAMRILDIRSQLAKEFIQDLTDVTGARRGSRSDCQLEPK